MDLSELDMGGKRLRDYQRQLIEKVRNEVANGNKNVIICSATGSGKTVIASALLKLCTLKGKYGMFLAPRRELVKQSSAALDDCDVRHSIVAAGFEYMPGGDVLIASKDTLAARTIRRERMPMPLIDMLVFDECHTSLALESRKLVEKLRAQNPNLVVIGLSATPGRADGKGMGDVYDSIVTAATYEQLRAEKFLVPCKVFAPDCLDMNGVKLSEWDSAAASKLDKPKLIGDIYKHWKELEDGCPTVAFGQTISHAAHIRDVFRVNGVKAELIEQGTPPDERDQILKDLHDGDLQVVTNCNCLSVGWDEPAVTTVIIASTSRSLVQFRQRAGRALRPHANKDFCTLIDHSGATFMHGFPDDDIEWPLERSRTVDQEFQQRRKEGKQKEPLHCPNCNAVYSGRPDCPNCGSRHQRRGHSIAVQRGLLREVKRESVKVETGSPEACKKFWHKCLATMANKGYTLGAAAKMYESKIHEPPWLTPGLPNIPDKTQWKKPVAEVYPQYLR